MPQPADINADDVDITLGRNLFAVQQFDQSALAGTGRPDNIHKFSLVNFQVDIKERVDAFLVFFINVGAFDHLVTSVESI